MPPDPVMGCGQIQSPTRIRKKKRPISEAIVRTLAVGKNPTVRSVSEELTGVTYPV
jgi:hypothetical protein